MRKAHNKNINNLFDFQAEDNIGNVSNNEKLNVLPATLGDGRAKRKDSISIPILKSRRDLCTLLLLYIAAWSRPGNVCAPHKVTVH